MTNLYFVRVWDDMIKKHVIRDFVIFRNSIRVMLMIFKAMFLEMLRAHRRGSFGKDVLPTLAWTKTRIIRKVFQSQATRWVISLSNIMDRSFYFITPREPCAPIKIASYETRKKLLHDDIFVKNGGLLQCWVQCSKRIH